MDDNLPNSGRQNKKCPSCGSEQPENAAFCGECGTRMSEVQEQKQEQGSDSLAPPTGDTPPTGDAPNRGDTPPARDNFYGNQRQYQYQQQYQPPMYPQYQQNPQDAPLSMGEYLLMLIAFGVPVVGLILMIVWSVSSSTNTNRKNFSRAMLILSIIGFIIGVILTVVFAAFFASIYEEIVHDFSSSQFFYGFDMSIFRRFLPW